MIPMRDEQTETMADTMRKELPTACLEQMLTLASDDPSLKMFQDLKNPSDGLGPITPNLKFLILDPVHLCITYKGAHAKKATPGSAFLHIIQNKFNQWSDDVDLHTYPSICIDPRDVVLSAVDERYRKQIEEFSMPKRTATALYNSIDGNAPYTSFTDYIKDIAALCSLFPDEARTPTAQQGKRLNMILKDATAPKRIGFYFNNGHRLSMMSDSERQQVASGTSGVEVLNRELNHRTRRMGEAYQSTVHMDCIAFSFLKLFVHNCAEYMPTGIQAPQHMFVSHNLSCWSLNDTEWKSVSDCTMLPLSNLRAEHADRIRKRPATVMKRPAKKVKRHTFNKKRVSD